VQPNPQNPRLVASSVLDRAGFRHAFPERGTPDAALLEALGSRGIAQIRQVHGAVAVEADAFGTRSAGAGEQADAIVGRRAGAAVGVRVADCVPVLVADEDTGAVAAIHAGWRGVVAGVVRAGVDLLAPAGRDPRRRSLVAAIGPCIGPCCFEVGADVAERVGFVVRSAGDKAYVDLRAAVRAQLRALGLDDDRIEDVPGCTKHELRFHSFRRDGADSGRMLAAIAAHAGR
jgi:YfiH family protein